MMNIMQKAISYAKKRIQPENHGQTPDSEPKLDPLITTIDGWIACAYMGYLRFFIDLPRRTIAPETGFEVWMPIIESSPYFPVTSKQVVSYSWKDEPMPATMFISDDKGDIDFILNDETDTFEAWITNNHCDCEKMRMYLSSIEPSRRNFPYGMTDKEYIRKFGKETIRFYPYTVEHCGFIWVNISDFGELTPKDTIKHIYFGIKPAHKITALKKEEK